MRSGITQTATVFPLGPLIRDSPRLVIYVEYQPVFSRRVSQLGEIQFLSWGEIARRPVTCCCDFLEDREEVQEEEAAAQITARQMCIVV